MNEIKERLERIVDRAWDFIPTKRQVAINALWLSSAFLGVASTNKSIEAYVLGNQIEAQISTTNASAFTPSRERYQFLTRMEELKEERFDSIIFATTCLVIATAGTVIACNLERD